MTLDSVRKSLQGSLVVIACGAGAGMAGNMLLESPVTVRWISPETRVAEVMKRFSAKGKVGRVPVINLLEAKESSTDSNVLFFDARSRLQFTQGHIPGAYHLSRSNFDSGYPELAEAIRASRQAIVYCSDSGCDEARRVAEALMQLGHENVGLFAEGWHAWMLGGLPVERVP